MLILLPPSEGKSAEPGDGVFRQHQPELVDDAQAVLKYLRGLGKDERGKVYGVKDPQKAAAVHTMNLGVLDAPCLKALERYTGVVYENLEYSTLKPKARAAKRIAIVSAMFGLIPGGACIPNYKLPITTWLAKYWRPTNGERLAQMAGGKPVLSLLPQSYAKAVEYDPLVHVDFRIEGGKKAAGHQGKAIKGRFVRFLVENDVRRVEDFGGFREDGYTFDGTNFVRS